MFILMLLNAVCDSREKGVGDNLGGNPQSVKCWNIRIAMICELSVVLHDKLKPSCVQTLAKTIT